MARDWQSTKHGTNIIMEHLLGTANRGSVSTDTSYSIDYSICFLDNVNGSDSADWMKATNDWAYAYPGGPVSQEYTSLTTATLSFWMKRGQSSGSTEGIVSGFSSARYGAIFLNTDQKLTFSHPLANAAPISHMSFEDYSAWYHMVLAFDTTSGTASERERFYVNGVEVDWATAPDWDEDQTFSIFSHSPSWLSIGSGGHYGNNDENSFTGYLAEWHFVDGQQLAPTEFGEVNDDGIWIPKEYDGTYGGTGFYLKFDDASNLGHDEDVHSGAGGAMHLDEQGLTTQNQSTDTPTNNFCTMNPLDAHSSLTLTEGNLKASYDGGNDTRAFATMAVANGKWYWEIKGLSPDVDSVQKWAAGVAEAENHQAYNDKSAGDGPYEVGLYTGNGKIYTNESVVDAFGEVTFAQNDIMMLAMDVDNLKMYWGKNGTWLNSGDPTSGATGTGAVALTASWSPFMPIFAEGNSNSQIWQVNFGGTNAFSISSGNADGAGYGNFEYAVPSGFYALCSKNLAEYG